MRANCAGVARLNPPRRRRRDAVRRWRAPSNRRVLARPASHRRRCGPAPSSAWPERAVGLAERDRLDRCAPSSPATIARTWPLPTTSALTIAHRPGGDARRRPAHAIGPARLQRLDQSRASPRPARARRRAARRGRRALRATSAASRSSRKSASASIRSAATVSPAAIAWPPPATSRPVSFAASTAAPRSTPEIERPDPLPMPVLAERDRRSPGGRSFSLSRPATMPITPGCQPSPRRPERRRDCPARRRAPRPPRCTAASIARRSSLSRSSSAAIASRLVLDPRW